MKIGQLANWKIVMIVFLLVFCEVPQYEESFGEEFLLPIFWKSFWQKLQMIVLKTFKFFILRFAIS